MRRIKKAKIKFISLVPRGANRLPTIFKDDGAFEIQLLTKDLGEQGELSAVVYAPELRDSQGDIASAAVVKDMLYTAAKEGLEIDIRHDGAAVGRERAFVAEQFIIQKGDPRFDGLADYEGDPVDPTGAWGVVIKIDDPALRKLYREGQWAGVSMGGVAEVVQEKEDPVERIVAAFEKRLNTPEEDIMAITPEDLAAISKAAAEAAVAAVEATQVEKKAPENDEPKGEEKNEAPVFKGDPTSAEDVAAHQKALKKHKLLAEVDWSDAEAVQKVLASLEEDKGDQDDASDELKKAQAELDKAKAKIKKLQGSSRQPSGGDDNDAELTDGALVGVDKENQRCAEIGLRMAQFMAKDRGR